MRDLGGGFEQDQAPLGGGGKDSPAAGLLRQGRMVEFRVECQERQLKAVLAAGLAVAGPLVAAASGQDRLDVKLEAGNVRGHAQAADCRDKSERKEYSELGHAAGRNGWDGTRSVP